MARLRKRARPADEGSNDFFDGLHDDIVISILSRLSSSACCPSDFINILITCKRLNRLGLNSLVLSQAGPKTLAVRASNWSENAHQFLKQCIAAGNTEASYSLGMIRFYCLKNRGSGASLMAKAALKSHAQALYSLSVIQFNGSGFSKNAKDLRAGVALCARAAYLGHIDALRELGHCLQDGYGIRQNIAEGRRLLIQANARELASILRSLNHSPSKLYSWQCQDKLQRLASGVIDSDSGSTLGCGIWSDFGCSLPATEIHPVNRFLTEWFGSREDGPGQGLRICTHDRCGRPETRRNEFRRCSGCGKVNYCSRGCQAHDWKMRHKVECAPIEQWMNQDALDEVVGEAVDADDDDDDDEGDDRMVEVE